MTLSELIKHVGDENVQFQNLSECFVSAQMAKRGTHITFGTQAVSALQLASADTGKVCLILWLPKERMPKV